MDLDKRTLQYLQQIRALAGVSVASATALMVFLIFWVSGALHRSERTVDDAVAVREQSDDSRWHAPDVSGISDATARAQVEYGRELIVHTARFLGPNGSVAHVSNGMNCQNCHLDAGTRPFGNNYAMVASTYPKFRARSGAVESIEKRVNDCFERSLNGTALDTTSEELSAIVSYIKFIGSTVDASGPPPGTGMEKLAFLDRPADPVAGKQRYELLCATCHGRNGVGVMGPDSLEHQFPPLWGAHSYNVGAGLYRLSNFAQFIHANMPLGATFDNPVLSEEEAWDIAAYVNSLPHPTKDLSADWPRPETKPVDHPFGPFADPFPERQHKYGPFKEIQQFYSKKIK